MRALSRLTSLLACVLLGVPTLSIGRVAHGGPGDRRARVGVLLFDERPEHDAALAGIREGFRLARIECDVLERRARGDEKAARTLLDKLGVERLDLVFAVGDRAATIAQRDWPGHVVYTAVSDPDALALTSAPNACGTASRIEAPRLLSALRSALPGLTALGVVVPDGDKSAERMVRRLEGAVRSGAEGLAGGIEIVQATTTETTAERRASSLLAALRPKAQVVWLPRGVAQEDAQALATALAGSGVLLAGSRRAHLDAGCALVLRTDDKRLGMLSVAQALRVLAGESPAAIPVRRLTRPRVEIHLDSAAALGWEPPLPLLAAADDVVPRVPRSRR